LTSPPQRESPVEGEAVLAGPKRDHAGAGNAREAFRRNDPDVWRTRSGAGAFVRYFCESDSTKALAANGSFTRGDADRGALTGKDRGEPAA
jgi:hypothetical protein